MKIAVSSDGDSLGSRIDQRFGRCRFFIIVDTDDENSFEPVENHGAIQGHGAGIKAAQQIGDLGVKTVITGQIGPNATNVLKQLGINTYHFSGIVSDAIEAFKNDKLGKITDISEPHSGIAVAKEQQKTERIFFPLLDNNGTDSRISPHFGHAPFFGVYDSGKKELEVIANDLDHTDPNKSPIDQIQDAVDPTVIFAKGIGGRAIGIISQKGLGLKTGPFDTVREVLENIDQLEEQKNSCGHEH